MKSAAMLACLACTAVAQNSDLGLLFGGATGTSQSVVSNGVVSGSNGASFGYQINYGWQLLGRPAGDLYIEIPFIASGGAVSGTVAGTTITGSTHNTFFFAPGFRYKFNPQARVALYALAGGGLASFGTITAVVATGSVSSTSSRVNTGAFAFGGGIDFRVTKLLSIRFEARDFVTRSGLGGTSGVNHLLLAGGIGFPF